MTNARATRERIRSKGLATREEIVARALNIAALEGLGALSIGGLAKELKMSKSGLFVHFGSKENLEKAVIEHARTLFFDQILIPIDHAGLEGIERLWALCDHWLTFVEKSALPGGYFFTGAFFQCAGRDGPVSAQITEVVREWFNTLKHAVDEARGNDELSPSVDAARTALELNGTLIGAQWSHLLEGKDRTRARSAIVSKLGSLATDKIPAGAFDSVKAWRKYLGSKHD
ncbi:MAG: TetR/AcrR family transcriptional regulator [Acidobacteria bacterium]|nr:TetR/AcrR family transcriptional regulator [Acidobacteriota bacterium]